MSRIFSAFFYCLRWTSRWLMCRIRNNVWHPEPMDLVGIHQEQSQKWDQIMEGMQTKGIQEKWKEENQNKIENCLKILASWEGNCLEIGSESGWMGKLALKRNPSCNYFGMDIRLEVLAQKNPNRLICGNALALPFPAESFQFVLARHVIEHLWDLDGFAANLRQVLKPGAKILIVVPLGYAYDPCHRWYFMTGLGWKKFLEIKLEMVCKEFQELGKISPEFMGVFYLP